MRGQHGSPNLGLLNIESVKKIGTHKDAKEPSTSGAACEACEEDLELGFA